MFWQTLVNQIELGVDLEKQASPENSFSKTDMITIGMMANQFFGNQQSIEKEAKAKELISAALGKAKGVMAGLGGMKGLGKAVTLPLLNPAQASQVLSPTRRALGTALGMGGLGLAGGGLSSLMGGDFGTGFGVGAGLGGLGYGGAALAEKLIPGSVNLAQLTPEQLNVQKILNNPTMFPTLYSKF